MRRLRQNIRVRDRMPIWGLRLLLGLILLTLAELVMWQNPPARGPLDWLVLAVLYVGLASIMLDLVVRFQVNGPATLVLAGGVFGLVASAIINHSAFDNIAAGPYGLLVRGLGLQTAAGIYGLLLFVAVMRGKQATPVQAGVAAAVGALWGIWVHWYPIQDRVNWGLMPIETASLYMLIALALIGVLVVLVAPRFRFIPEQQVQLQWWEAILAGFPLFIALVVGMAQDLVPVTWLILLVAIGAFIVWVLSYQSGGTDPSLLAEMTFAAPNAITFILLAVTFLVAGTLAYNLVDSKDSVAGIVAYWIAFGFGTFGVPIACLIIFWRVFRAQTAPVTIADLMDEDGD